MFHYSLFSFSWRDSFLSGSHLESIQCLFPVGPCEEGGGGGWGGSRGVCGGGTSGMKEGKCGKLSWQTRLSVHKLPSFDNNQCTPLLTAVVYLYMQRHLSVASLHFTFPSGKKKKNLYFRFVERTGQVMICSGLVRLLLSRMPPESWILPSVMWARLQEDWCNVWTMVGKNGTVYYQ